MKTIIIASMDRNGVIGRTSKPCDDCVNGAVSAAPYRGYRACGICRGSGRVPANDIPWSYPEIDVHFDRMTMGHAVVMGRRTWEARGGRPLSGRANVVISRHMFDGEPGVYVATTLDGALRMVRAYEETNDTAAYVIGGAKLFAAALPLADELDLALIDREHEGDVRFPWSADATRAASDLNPWASYKLIRTHGVRFDLVEQRQGSTPELTFTRWVRR